MSNNSWTLRLFLFMVRQNSWQQLFERIHVIPWLSNQFHVCGKKKVAMLHYYVFANYLLLVKLALTHLKSSQHIQILKKITFLQMWHKLNNVYALQMSIYCNNMLSQKYSTEKLEYFCARQHPKEMLDCCQLLCLLRIAAIHNYQDNLDLFVFFDFV